MNKTSLASLQERLLGWIEWNQAMYQVGACLGFWPEFGAPGDAIGPFDSWHGTKDVIHTDIYRLGGIIEYFLTELVGEGCLEMKSFQKDQVSFIRWNPNYKGPADIITILENDEFSCSSTDQSAVSKTEEVGLSPTKGAK